MNEPQSEKPADFGKYIAFGFLLGIGSMLFQIVVGPYGPYGVIYQFGVVLALSVAVPWLLLRLTRRSIGKNRAAMFGCLYGALLLGSMPVLIQAMIVLDWHDNVPLVENFAASDFESVDKDGDSIVTFSELDAIDRGQRELKAKIQQLESAKRAIVGSGSTIAPVQQAVGEIEQLIKESEKHLLPEDKMRRIRAVQSNLHLAGHIVADPIPGKGENSRYGVSTSEIATHRQRLDERYHYWFVTFRLVGLIDR